MEADECRCDRCQTVLRVGDYPFCPHGPARLASHGDDVPGGFWVENGFDRPRKFYSKKEHVRALAEEGCELAPKYAGPLDKHLTNWATVMDPYTLSAATALVSRPGRASAPDEECPVPEGDHPEITGRVLTETFRGRRA